MVYFFYSKIFLCITEKFDHDLSTLGSRKNIIYKGVEFKNFQVFLNPASELDLRPLKMTWKRNKPSEFKRLKYWMKLKLTTKIYSKNE